MRGKFEQRRWNYGLVLLFLIGESFWLSFVIVYTGIFVLISQSPDDAAKSILDYWALFDTGFKLSFFDMFETLVIALAVSTLLILKHRSAFVVYLVNVGLFIGLSIDKIIHLDTNRYGLTTEETMFGLIFGSIQVGLVAWGLWSICYQEPVKNEGIT